MRFYMGLKGSLVFLLYLTVFFSSSTAFPEEKYVVDILTNKGIKQYDQSIAGFETELAQKNFNVSYNIYDQDLAQNPSIVGEILDTKPNHVLAVGTEKALFAKENFKDLPVVFSMVLDPIEGGIVESWDNSGKNLSGVSLKISVEKQFEKLKKILPDVKSVGMLYDAKNKQGLRLEAEHAAQNLGLRLVAKSVISKADVADALDELVTEVDCLWAGVDTLIYNPQSAKHILLTTLRSKIPFMAFSSHYVDAGALMALECDYEDIGKQTADIVTKILAGESPGSIPIEFPRKLKLITNQNTAEVLDLQIPQELFD